MRLRDFIDDVWVGKWGRTQKELAQEVDLPESRISELKAGVVKTPAKLPAAVVQRFVEASIDPKTKKPLLTLADFAGDPPATPVPPVAASVTGEPATSPAERAA